MKIEVVTYEYEDCVACRHGQLDFFNYKKHEYEWGCKLTGKHLYYSHLMEKPPKWCPLPDKAVT